MTNNLKQTNPQIIRFSDYVRKYFEGDFGEYMREYLGHPDKHVTRRLFNNTCVICNQTKSSSRMVIDHIIPKSYLIRKYGFESVYKFKLKYSKGSFSSRLYESIWNEVNDFSNLRLVCQKCDKEKNDIISKKFTEIDNTNE